MSKTKQERITDAVESVQWAYTTALTPGQGYRAAFKVAWHASRRDLRHELLAEIIRLAREYTTGDVWPPSSESVERAVAKAFAQIGIDNTLVAVALRK